LLITDVPLAVYLFLAAVNGMPFDSSELVLFMLLAA
jgi:hypothetical protein